MSKPASTSRGGYDRTSHLQGSEMIVNHDHRFVFVQVPQTGSTAIGTELVENYGAEHVLMKHSTLIEARLALGSRIRGYRVFTSVRHPIDQAVSSYYKLKTDHKGTNERDAAQAGNRAERVRAVEQGELDASQYVHDVAARHTFAPVWLLSQRASDFVIRFEQLAEDFDEMLRRLGITPVRALPVRNETSRPRDETADPVPEAFRPFMVEWGYEPSGGAPISFRRRLAYRLTPAAKQIRRMDRIPRLRRMVATGAHHGG